ncbi:hypothetical protein [Bacillus cereus]|uniref:hypothetical protein n=1 Tax=Bacillus cereus TaxID=1396 RepID=UPI00115C6E18|nr:hypothetical protein [Bacillus cereus]
MLAATVTITVLDTVSFPAVLAVRDDTIRAYKISTPLMNKDSTIEFPTGGSEVTLEHILSYYNGSDAKMVS